MVLLALVAGDAWYLFRLYDSIKVESLRAVGECLRRADILEIISRLDGSRYGGDSSFIKLTLMIQRENDSEGGYGYPGILENVGQTMSEYFHIMEMADTTMSGRDYAMLDSLFRRELADAGLRPEVVFVRPFDEAVAEDRGLWSVDFALREGQPPLYRAYFSGLGGHVLRQMAGILVMSGGILLIAGFLIWYLLHWVGKLKSIEQMKDDFTHNMTHELKTPVAVAYAAADSMLRYYDQSDEARNRRFLGIILQRLGFLSGMIENILSMSMERFRSLKLNIEEVDFREVELSHIEAVILDELFRHPNEVVEARRLMWRVWQNDDYNNLNRLHGFIYKLRRYLSGSDGIDILNVRGVGYKLSLPRRGRDGDEV